MRNTFRIPDRDLPIHCIQLLWDSDNNNKCRLHWAITSVRVKILSRSIEPKIWRSETSTSQFITCLSFFYIPSQYLNDDAKYMWIFGPRWVFEVKNVQTVFYPYLANHCSVHRTFRVRIIMTCCGKISRMSVHRRQLKLVRTEKINKEHRQNSSRYNGCSK